jgi:ribosomal protein S12 methylthiotransferase accessory factor
MRNMPSGAGEAVSAACYSWRGILGLTRPEDVTPRLEDVLRHLVGARFSVIKRIGWVPVPYGCPPIYCATTLVNHPGRISGDTGLSASYQVGGSGAGLTAAQCLWATIGETVERYCAAIYFRDQLILRAYDELGHDALDPNQLVTYDKAQYSNPGFGFSKFDGAIPIWWTRGRSLRSKHDIWIPAQVAHFGFKPTEAERIVQHLSTGLGAGLSQAQAILAGTCEVIERDAFMLYWLTRTTPPKLDQAQLMLMSELCGVDGIIRHPTVDLTVFALPTEFDVPVFLGMIRPRGTNIAVFGASCHPDARLAFRKAVIEAAHTMTWAKDSAAYGDEAADEGEVATFHDHARFYLQERNFEHLEFLLDSSRHNEILAQTANNWLVSMGEQCVYSCEADYARLLEKVATSVYDSGYEITYLDTTTDDIRELGFTAIKALIPGLQPLYCGARNLSLDHKRLSRFATSRFATECHMNIDPSQINRIPHPFP